MKKILFLSCLFILGNAVFAQVDKDLEYYNYELECMGTGTDGTYLIKVWSYARRPKVAINEGKRNAVHGVIFKGFAGGNNCQSQKALAPSPGLQEQFKDYFTAFFSDGGDYLKYVNISNDGTPEVIRMKRKYKVGYVVSVMKDVLRADLEQAGVIKGLNSGF